MSRTTNRQHWDILSISKRRILEFVDDVDADASQGGSASYNLNNRLGDRVAAVKFAQRMILVQARLIQDPRVRTAVTSLHIFMSNTDAY